MRRLARKHQITVYTSTALDYVTWRNEYRPGSSDDEGVTVRRFAVERQRDQESFNHFSDWIYANRHSDEDEKRWLEDQGPLCPELVAAFQVEQDRYDAVIFYTYLYYPTVECLRLVSRPCLLVPTAHREPAARLRMFGEVYRRPDGLVFNTHAEGRLVQEMYHPPCKHRQVAGVGITPPSRQQGKLKLARPSILYAGRIDAGKGCAELVEFFVRFRVYQMPCNLYLMGSLQMRLPKHPSIHYLGYLSEEDKFAAYRGADVTAIPSRFESLSIVALESLYCGTPILVNAGSEVLREHCTRSNAGLFYENFDEFAETLGYMLRRGDVAAELGGRGKRYVAENYTWDKVLARYDAALQQILNR